MMKEFRVAHLHSRAQRLLIRKSSVDTVQSAIALCETAALHTKE